MKQDIILGCMRIGDKTQPEVEFLIKTALDLGINHFDHADIYGGGNSELIFSKAVKALKISRSDVIIQSKSSIKPGISYDASYEYIIESVTKILERLDTDYLDYYLLHRPDVLMDAKEVARAFNYLYDNKMVKNFGVSNFTSMQIEYLQKNLKFKIMIDQIQLSIPNSFIIDNSINFNMRNDFSIDRTSGILDYAKLNDLSLQAWSPFQYGMFEGPFLGNDKFTDLNKKIDFYASKYNVSKEAIVVAWLLRIPNVSPVVGTTNPNRLKKIAEAKNFNLLHDEWYDIYLSCGHILP